MSTRNDPSEPLDDAELALLDEFLLNRLDDETADRLHEAGEDEGIIDVSELDGFLTAILSGPNLIMPSKWLPAVWGAQEPEWDSPQQFEAIFHLILRHQNSIAADLGSNSGTFFEPLFEERTVSGRVHVIVDEWCHGYMRGVMLDAPAWRAGGERVEALLEPIKLFGTEEGWKELKSMSEAEQDVMRKAIPTNVLGLNMYWLLRRSKQVVQRAEPARRAGPKVGRNDPCPCGSGKKYKQCCLH